ncbi:putative zinc-binding metallopeptidase [Bacteroides heparinolyticus]|uniref:putative zinc-binding metallopeptidase n=2 Tax=Prevotella heparinolytica TaxID=28113 RepID=UPI0023F63884|nr:putative zinc-binding metallopeptidase [Bacteroides heparinolyticus]MCI6213374.1 putative zinc-binding metallopeptidase [Bacteroides heparinolyticus]
MKTISSRTRFCYLIGRSLYLFTACLLLAGCEQEAALSDQSVVDLSMVQRNKTELDEWILNTFTRPYGIEIEYRWDKNVAQNGSYTYPPESANVKSVLETIKALWIDLYTTSDLGGEKFFLGKNPVKIYMYGGKNIDGNGVELLGNTEATTNEMFLYNVNDFDPKDEDKVFILMRSVHHQFAKHLMVLFPYDRNKFLSISKSKYLESTKLIATIFKGDTQGRNLLTLSRYAYKRGFFTFHSFLSAEDDFAEIISTKLTHSPKDVLKALAEAKEPNHDPDPEVQQTYDEEARQAYKELTEKQAFVEDFFNKEIKISLNYLQLISMKQLKAYMKQK